MADDVVRQAVQGISDIITVPGLVNLDFADVRAVMKGMGSAVMGTGLAEGDKRAVEAAKRAIENPLLDDSSIAGARGVIVNITGGDDLSLDEASEATELITKEAHPDANVIYGIVVDPAMSERVKVTVIATGFERKAGASQFTTPVDLANYRFPENAAASGSPSGPPAPPAAQPAQPAAAVSNVPAPAQNTGNFYRKTPQHPLAMAAGAENAGPNLDVPAFLRKQSNG
jgi:cell division protein FtsZ